MENLARITVLAGSVLVVVGVVLYLLPRLGVQIGRLPGDFNFQLGQLSCVVPIATSILLSVILTVLLNIIVRFLGR